MLDQVACTGARSIVCEKEPHHFVAIPLYRFHLWQLGENAIHKISNLPASSPAHHLINVTRKVPGARALWHCLFRRGSRAGRIPVWDATKCPDSTTHLNVDFFRALLKQAFACSSSTNFKAVPKRFVLVNAGLAAGGAERQIVNTLQGLKSRGFDDICLLGEYLHSSPGLDFYLPQLESAAIAANSVGHSIILADHGFTSVPEALGGLLAKLPGAMAEEILNLVEEFRMRRPSVVHAWQDSTSIKAGIAAVIAGVPRIVLGSRNVIPINFAYYQDYMHSAYVALAELSHIIFLNNSEAGACDYCRWLGLPRERFQVVRNGVNFGGLTRISDSSVSAYRDSLGIPKNAPVVGSIFRFWSEKRPMLWLEVVKEIAGQVPNAHFLLIGEGPMRGEMEDFVRKSGLEKTVHMPGARTDIATPLSAMTVFLLTSAFEGTPNVVLEAQWLGLPVVATDSGGTREAIEEGMTGWCCTADAIEIAAKIKAVFSDCSRLAELRHLGPCFIDKQFGLCKMIDHTLRLYG
jgi:glycosyltransferase involved in cell wall biosynthesis